MNIAIDHSGFTVTQPARPTTRSLGFGADYANGVGRQVRTCQVSRAFVFTDIVASTELAEQLGDRHFAALLQRHNAVVAELAARHGASDSQFLGDGYLVVLPHARAALGFAPALQAAIGALRERAGLPLRIRIGINAGSVHLAGGEYVGRNVILARRLCEHARADEILVSARLRGDEPTFGAVRDRRFKGILGSEAACTLAWTA